MKRPYRNREVFDLVLFGRTGPRLVGTFKTREAAYAEAEARNLYDAVLVPRGIAHDSRSHNDRNRNR